MAPATTSSVTGVGNTLLYTASAAGQYRVCAYLDNVAVASTGFYYFYIQYTSDGHGFSSNVLNNTSATTQWTQGQNCFNFYVDAGSQIRYGVGASSVTGTPTERYAATLEQLQ